MWYNKSVISYTIYNTALHTRILKSRLIVTFINTISVFSQWLVISVPRYCRAYVTAPITWRIAAV